MILSKKDHKLIDPLLEEFEAIHLGQLPRCFVHGDILTTNTIKDKKGKLWIIDFSVSNYYPRIVELAVLGCNILFNPKNKTKSTKNFETALMEYQKRIPLKKQEIEALPIFLKVAHAMHIICATYEKVVNRNKSKENEYWIEQGRAGLRQLK